MPLFGRGGDNISADHGSIAAGRGARVTGNVLSGGNATYSAPPLTAKQKQGALDYAAENGLTKEYALIKTLNVNLGSVVSGPVEVVKNVTDIIKWALGID